MVGIRTLRDIAAEFGVVERTIAPCATALKDAGCKVGDIDDIILVGGQSRMPKVQDKVKEFFGKDPRKDVNPDEAVAVKIILATVDFDLADDITVKHRLDRSSEQFQ